MYCNKNQQAFYITHHKLALWTYLHCALANNNNCRAVNIEIVNIEITFRLSVTKSPSHRLRVTLCCK